MKRITIFYWIFTGLSTAMMLLSSIPNILQVPDAKVMVTDHLHYPPYFLPYIGVCKFFGAIVIIIPGYPRIKEWAYAGLIFDLIGAIYCNYAAGRPTGEWLPIIFFIALGFASYFLYHKKSVTLK